MTAKKNIFAVIGGAGAMGRICVRDLAEFSSSADKILIADYDYPKAQILADSFKSPQISAVHVDVTNLEQTTKALHGATVIINCIQYQLNLAVMMAALKLRAHYIDLGGLFHMTRKQLTFDSEFKQIKRLALIGMGAAPGITNILSRLGADELDRVTEIHTRVAGRDFTKYSNRPALPVSYSLQTILEEFSMEPAVFTKGKFRFVRPMSGDELHSFPAPVGKCRPMYTLHSEVATLPLSFMPKGVKEVSFKIAFDPEFIERVRFLRDLGLASHDPLEVSGVKVKPIEVVNKIAMSQPSASPIGKLKQHEIVRAIVKGKKAKNPITVILDCHTEGFPKWGVGTDINTGSPPAIAARMLVNGEIKGAGVLPAEITVPPDLFLQELEKRKMWVNVKREKGWDYPT